MSVHDETIHRRKQQSAQLGEGKGIGVVTHWREGVNKKAKFSLEEDTLW